MQEEDYHESRWTQAALCALGQPSLQSDTISNKIEVGGEAGGREGGSGGGLGSTNRRKQNLKHCVRGLRY